jgi:molecular chaperone GrpE (heat shock protein)
MVEAVNLLDFLEMGLVASTSSPQVYEGMKMAYNCCLEIFKKKNIEVVEVKKGDAFDSSIHKVIGVMPDEKVEAGKIISGRSGYVLLSGSERRALKHAEVILSEDKAVN